MVCICTVLGPVCGPYLILAKVGIEGVNSTLATAIRTVVVLAMSWGMVFLTWTQGGMGEISRRSWLFLILSGRPPGRPGCATTGPCSWPGLSGGAHRQAQRGDHPGAGLCVPPRALYRQSMVGCALIAAGTLFMVL